MGSEFPLSFTDINDRPGIAKSLDRLFNYVDYSLDDLSTEDRDNIATLALAGFNAIYGTEEYVQFLK